MMIWNHSLPKWYSSPEIQERLQKHGKGPYKEKDAAERVTSLVR